jgi:hypothetical protein
LQVECKEDLCWAAFEDLLQGVATINPEVMISMDCIAEEASL